jgi:Uma2 family endonuclease
LCYKFAISRFVSANFCLKKINFAAMTITSLDQLDPNGIYTYADYLLWQFEERVELLRGKIRQMAAPSMKHQRTVTRLTRTLANALWKTPCQVFVAPFDVRLTRTREDKDAITVVQPDLCVICDPAKLDARGCNGAPDLIIEILSPGNSRTEMKDKFELYQEAGVLEYWVVSPIEKTIQVWVLNEQGIYIGLQPKVEGDLLTTPIIANLEVDVTEVFED